MKRTLVWLFLALGGMAPIEAQVVAVAPELPLLVTSSDGSHAEGGQAVDMVREAAKRANLSIDIQIQPWTRALVTVGQNRNTVLFPMARTSDREDQYEWIGPVSRLEYWVFALRDRGDLKATNLSTLPPGSFGTLANDVAFGFLKPRVGDKLQSAPNYSSLAPMFLSGRFDYLVVVPTPFFAELARLGKPRTAVQALFPLEGVLSDPYSYLVAAKGANPELVGGLRKAVAGMMADGTWEKIYQKYQAPR